MPPVKGARSRLLPRRSAAYDMGDLSLQATIGCRLFDGQPPEGTLPEDWQPGDGSIVETTLGRALFNEALPSDYPYVNQRIGKKELGSGNRFESKAVHEDRHRRDARPAQGSSVSIGPPFR